MGFWEVSVFRFLAIVSPGKIDDYERDYCILTVFTTSSIDEYFWGNSILGLSMTTESIPSLSAALIFSSTPPASPLSLVTIVLIRYCLNIARFKSSENGPCMAIMFVGGIPISRHNAMCSDTGRIRTYNSFSSFKTTNLATLDMPVVRHILLPSVLDLSTASAIVLTLWIKVCAEIVIASLSKRR